MNKISLKYKLLLIGKCKIQYDKFNEIDKEIFEEINPYLVFGFDNAIKSMNCNEITIETKNGFNLNSKNENVLLGNLFI